MNPADIINDLAEHASLRIRSCSEHTHDAEWIESKTHPDYDIWLVQSGQITIHIDQTAHIAEVGDAVLFFPHMPYTAQTNAEGCRFIYLHFHFGIGHNLRILDELVQPGIIHAQPIRREAELLTEVYNSGRSQNNVASFRLKGALMLLLAQILERGNSGSYSGTFGSASTQASRPQNLYLLRPVLKFIDEHLHVPIRMKQLAEVAGLSEKYFITYFKATLGITPKQYIDQLKMNRARELLYQQTYSIKEIAARLGYPDAFTFSKSFKKSFHVPPSKFV